MSEVAENQENVSFEAIEDIIKNLCMEINSECEWIVDHGFDEEFKPEDLDTFPRQAEIAKRFRQLHSVCKNDDDKKKLKELSAWCFEQSVTMFSRLAVSFESDVRDNEAMRNHMQELRPVLAGLKSAISAEDEKTDPIEFTTGGKSGVSLADEKTGAIVSPPEKTKNDDKHETPVEFGAAFLVDLMETMQIAASKIDCFPKVEGVEESHFIKTLREMKEIQDSWDELILDSEATNRGKDERTNNFETENLK